VDAEIVDDLLIQPALQDMAEHFDPTPDEFPNPCAGVALVARGE
jgi:hypothetical protein